MRKFLALTLFLTSTVSACWNGNDAEGKNNWYFASVEYVFNQCETPDVVLDSTDWLSGLNEAFKAREIKLLTAIVPIKTRIYKEELPNTVIPSNMVLSRYDRIMANLKNNGVATIDVNQEFLKQKDKKNSFPLFYKTDFHWSSQGSDLTAKLIANWINSSGVVQNSPVTAWHQSILPARQAPFTRFGNNLPVAPEKREKYIPIAYSKEGGNLLDDSYPDIAVVGDSFSHGEFDDDGRAPFSSAIGFYSNRDVLNASQAGRGPFLPFFDYVTSSNFQKHPPKIVVFELWEALMQAYDGGDGSMFNHKGRLEDNFFLSSAAAITGCTGGQELKLNTRPRFNQFISFSLPKNLEKPQISLNGEFSKIRYDLPKSGDEGNVYNVPLADIADGNIKSIDITNDGNLIQPVVMLCDLPTRVADVASLDGKSVDLTRRNFPNQVKFSGLYPVPDESSSRWGLNESSSFQYYAKTPGTVQFKIDGTSYYPNQTIAVLHNGHSIALLKTSGVKYTFTYSSQVKVSAGKNTLTLIYSQNAKSNPAYANIVRKTDSRPLTVRFTRLELNK